ncbi:MAG TPA: hypothetical protein VK002_14350 [Rubricoccaceae bacterium]|nr:hypothetical protein [Rubricoccaceae bacterium]
MPRPPLLLLGLAGLLAVGLACEAEVEVPEATVTPEAVERYRTGVVVQMQEIDGAIAALETTAEQADSATAAAYGPALDVLRRERQAIQAALDGLHGTTPEAFDAATAALDARIDEFEEQVGDAPLVLALDAEQLRRAAAARFEALDREVQESPALQQATGELVQRRQEIEGELARLGAPEVSFTEVRATVVRRFEALFDRLDELRIGGAPSPATAPADVPPAPAPAPAAE